MEFHSSQRPVRPLAYAFLLCAIDTPITVTHMVQRRGDTPLPHHAVELSILWRTLGLSKERNKMIVAGVLRATSDIRHI